MIGHLLAAAGAVEFVATVMAVHEEFLPPTINIEAADDECDLDYVPHVARVAAPEAALSTSFGFGGQNACLTIRRWIKDLGAESIDFMDFVFRLEDALGTRIPFTRWQQFVEVNLADSDPSTAITPEFLQTFAEEEMGRS